MRDRFDKNKDIKDLRLAKKLLEDGEEELWNVMHPQPIVYATDPEGPAYGRVTPIRDWVLDYWHPLEKLEYRTYFGIREKRKKEYLKFFENEYNNPKST